MAEDAETKKIARLDFDVKNAINNLDIIDKKLKSIAESSNLYAKQIGKNIGSSFDFSKVLNVDSFSQQLSKVTNISEAQAKRLVTNMMRNEQNVTAKTKIEQEKRQTAITQNNARQLTSQAKTADKEILINANKNARIEIDNNKHANKMEEINTRQANSVKTLYDRVANYAETYLIYQGFNILKEAISDVIDEMVELENSMVQIDRVLNESSLDIDDYRDKLIQVAYDYGNSMDNVADITLRLAQAGFDSNEALKLTEKTLLALNTAELNATQATDDMVAVMAQWGLMTGNATEEAKQYGAIIDKINKVADNYPTTSADLMDALKKTSSAFNLAGASIDETIALITAAEKASQRGGKVIGTALSNIVQQLKDEKRLDIAESLGLNFFTDEKKTQFKGIVDIFAEMSEKMQQLKDAGKESSVEMQQLLSIFTVFRRNIGSSLLGQMSGEDNTYLQVLNDSLTATGYSLQENAKYMATAKAAQEQFNTSVLQLKTQVWDSGVEDVYKSMLIFGKELVNNIGMLVDEFGGLPVIVGTATLAFSLLSKQMKIVSYDATTGTAKISGLLKGLTDDIKKVTFNITAMPKAIKSMNTASSMSFKTLWANMTKYGVAMDAGVLKTLALKAAIVGLNLAAMAAATAGIMLLTSIIQELINKEAAAIELQKNSIESTEKQVSAREEEITNLNELMSMYDELGQKTNLLPEETTRLLEIQTKIKNILGEQADTIDLMNGKYEEQKEKIAKLTLERKKELLADKERLMWQKQNAKVEVDLPSQVSKYFGSKDYEKTLMQYGGTGLYNGSLKETIENSSMEEAVELFTKWEENLRKIAKDSDELENTYNWVNETLNKLKENTKETDAATEAYYETLASIKIDEMFPEDSITNAEQYKTALESLQEGMENNTGNAKIYQEALVELFMEKFPQFAETIKNTNDGIIVTDGELKELQETSDKSIESLVGLESGFKTVYSAMDEFNQQGYVSASTLQNLINNDLLQYLDIVDGKLSINEAAMANAATAAKAKAIEDLQAKAAAEIAAVAFNTESSAASGAASTTSNMTTKANNVKNALISLTPKVLENANAWVELNKSMGGTLEGLGDEQKKQINDIMNNLGKSIRTINSIKITGVSYTRTSARGSGGGSSGSSSSSSSKKDKEYEKRLKYFTDTIDKMESKEEEWVNKQKSLGLLSNSDMVYVTKRRIKEYEEYLKKIKKATWMNKEDRQKLTEEYTKKLKEAQLDYFEYLKDKLDDEVKAIEETRDKKIKALEEETNKKIALLEKEKEAEDNLNKRKELVQDVEYWKQRTGREATENLAKAQKALKEFDEDARRDAQIKALEEEEQLKKESIERQAQNEIDALTKVYNSKVKAFSESNKIIYDNSVISAKNLYNAYKKNFVDPLKEDLQYINKKKINYTVKKGDTLESIAKEIKKTTGEKVSTIIKRIKNANSSLKNTKNTAKLKKGTKIKIPMYHKGGIAEGDPESLALLKKGEVVLRPEWSASLNRMMKYFDNIAQGKTQGINNNSTIEVSGNLVNIQASVRNQSDIDAIGQKVEKILKEKFNIKK